MAFVAPLAVGAMVEAGNQAWLNALWDLVVTTPASVDGYYENTLKLLSLIVLSGNWWAPEQVAAGPCVAPTVTPTPSATPTPTATPECPATPRADCRAPIVAGAAALALRDRDGETKDTLAWKWGKGAATTAGDLGNPTTTTRYDLCLYDGASTLIASAAAPAGGLCAGRPCWRATGNGYRFTQKELLPNGVASIDLKSGTAGKARITLKGKGIPLELPTLPIAPLPVTVQLTNGVGVCWSASYQTDVRTNDDESFKANSD